VDGFAQNLAQGSPPGRNQLCQIFWQSVQGSPFCGGSNFALLHWLRLSPLIQCCATARLWLWMWKTCEWCESVSFCCCYCCSVSLVCLSQALMQCYPGSVMLWQSQSVCHRHIAGFSLWCATYFVKYDAFINLYFGFFYCIRRNFGEWLWSFFVLLT